MIRTLLHNLVDNAIKFTRRGRVRIAASRTGGWVTITVRDTGTGIASTAREEVFTRFYKKNPAMQGTGLGLPICREIAELHGGTVRISSNERGKGTTVAVRLSVRPAAARRAGKGEAR
jgi:signal transduction histidine kinase